MAYYIIQKYRHGEHVRFYVWVMLVVMFLTDAFAIYVFEIPVTNKMLTPRQSLELNKPCVLLGFFDYHDIWHFLSAIGVVMFFFVVYLLDTDIDYVDRKTIKVF